LANGKVPANSDVRNVLNEVPRREILNYNSDDSLQQWDERDHVLLQPQMPKAHKGNNKVKVRAYVQTPVLMEAEKDGKNEKNQKRVMYDTVQKAGENSNDGLVKDQ
jgi:hypothetical protein